MGDFSFPKFKLYYKSIVIEADFTEKDKPQITVIELRAQRHLLKYTPSLSSTKEPKS